MPMSSVRMIRASAAADATVPCACSTAGVPANARQANTAKYRRARIGGGSIERTEVLRTLPTIARLGGPTRPLLRVTCSGDTEALLPFATRGRPLWERAKFREHAHQQFLATLDVQLAIDTPQIGVHGVRRQAEPLRGVFLRRAVEHRAHDAALPRREPEAARERAPLRGHEDTLSGDSSQLSDHATNMRFRTKPASNRFANYVGSNPAYSPV